MNQLLSISITFILWQAYAYFEGQRDAYYYNAVNGKDSNNIHWVFVAMRTAFGGGLLCNAFVCDVPLTAIACLLAFLIASFSFWHNSKYYETRHILNNAVYPKGWSSTSTTSRATFDLSFNQRCWGLVIGVLFFIGAIINLLINR